VSLRPRWRWVMGDAGLAVMQANQGALARLLVGLRD
jgi:hypothetical protein